MKYKGLLLSSIFASTLAVTTSIVPAPAHSETYNLCALDTVPAPIIRRVIRRSDFDDLLSQMVNNCPVAALALTEAATAASGLVSDDPGAGDAGDSNSNDGNGGNGGGGGNGSGDDDGGDDDGGDDDGGDGGDNGGGGDEGDDDDDVT